jgi:hypothetical protein
MAKTFCATASKLTRLAAMGVFSTAMTGGNGVGLKKPALF